MNHERKRGTATRRNELGSTPWRQRGKMAGGRNGARPGLDKGGRESSPMLLVQCVVAQPKGGPGWAARWTYSGRTAVHGRLPLGAREQKEGGPGEGRQGTGLPGSREQRPRGGRAKELPHGELPCGTAAHGGRWPGPVRRPV